MKLHVYKMECITNLHVGDGDTNYNIIENQVQRDVVLGVPTIHSSGIKGALRFYVESESKDKSLVNRIFGSDGEEKTMGEYKFFAGNIAAMPLRISRGDGIYVLATCPGIITNLTGQLLALGMSFQGKENEFPKARKDIVLVKQKEGAAQQGGMQVEGLSVLGAESELLDYLLGEHWALLTDEDFQSFDLPVQARNALQDGKSQNVWYEEVVPHKSVFYMSMLTPDDRNDLDAYIDGKVVQFGANASVGYGYCRMEKVEEKNG